MNINFRNKNLIKSGFWFFILCFIGAWIGTDIYLNELSTLDDLNKNSYASQKQYEIALIYIGCSTCQYANIEELQPAFKKIKEAIKEQAFTYGYGFTTIGISEDYIITEGLVHLAKYGAFDEVMTGNSWSNTGLLKYVYGEIPGKAATPQVIVTRRKFNNDLQGGNNTEYRGIKNETLLIRKIGVNEIIDLAANKTPLHQESFNFEYNSK